MATMGWTQQIGKWENCWGEVDGMVGARVARQFMKKESTT